MSFEPEELQGTVAELRRAVSPKPALQLRESGLNDIKKDNGEEDKRGAMRFYEGQIPAFTESALETLYGALYSSLPQLALGALDGVSTYAASDNTQLRALFLYLRKGREIRVINEGMAIDAADAELFAHKVFTRYSTVTRVRFHAVRLTGAVMRQPSWRAPLTEDIVIDLPADEATYLASLGKSKRKTLRQNQARAESLSHQIISGAEVDATLMDTIIGFNHARMAGKQRASALDSQASHHLMTLVRARGMVGLVSIAGTLRAGTLACRFGDDVYSLVNAHDPAVNHLGMGNLSRHLMILAAIRSGARRFHLLGGHFASKRSCGARRIPLEDVTIYRSRIAMAADVAGIATLALRSANYRLRVAIEDEQIAEQTKPGARFAGRCVQLARDMMQTVRRMKIAQP